jgi:hypothetical protein
MNNRLKLDWKLSEQPFEDLAFGLVGDVKQLTHTQVPDIADMFPFNDGWSLRGYISDGWIAVHLSSQHGVTIPTIGEMKSVERDELVTMISPYTL